MLREEALSYLESYVGGVITDNDANLISAINYLDNDSFTSFTGKE